jgi:multisubunit Na+/H+ antiporter MnhC subunit
MSDGKNSVQMVLNVFGFVFIALGLGLDGRAAMLLLGLAIASFAVALLIPMFGDSSSADPDDTGKRS